MYSNFTNSVSRSTKIVQMGQQSVAVCDSAYNVHATLHHPYEDSFISTSLKPSVVETKYLLLFDSKYGKHGLYCRRHGLAVTLMTGKTCNRKVIVKVLQIVDEYDFYDYCSDNLVSLRFREQ